MLLDTNRGSSARAWQNKILKSENDTHEFVAYFQKEMETKDGMISKLNDELIRKEVSQPHSFMHVCVSVLLPSYLSVNKDKVA